MSSLAALPFPAPIAPAESAYLATYLQPFARWLEAEGVSEILVNRPGEVWIEANGMAMVRHPAPEVDDALLERLAGQVARVTHQGVNREQPLLAATLPDGARIQLAGPPVTRRHWALAIRRHRMLELGLEDYDHGPLPLPPADADGDPAADPVGFLRQVVRARRTILISGGTSSGKTTFLNALLGQIDPGERVVLVEDTPELALPTANGVALVAVRGELGEARIGTDELVRAALRLRPDRLVLGELRGPEAVAFLRAVNTGHPGSFTTIHANSPRGALEQLALLAMQARTGLTRGEILDYAVSVIDWVVQLGRVGGQRRILAIARARDLLMGSDPG